MFIRLLSLSLFIVDLLFIGVGWKTVAEVIVSLCLYFQEVEVTLKVF